MTNNRFTKILFFILCGCISLTAAQPEDRTSARPQKKHPGDRHITAVLEKMKKNRPEDYRRLQQLRINDRPEFFRQLRALMPPDARHQFYARCRELDSIQKQLAKQYQETPDGAAREEILKKLKAAISESHDFFIEDMKKRISRMQKRISQMEANSARIQEQKLQRLLNLPAAKTP